MCSLVIHWIGGLSFVTLIALPLARSRATREEALLLFEGVERRFSAQLRVTIPLVGATGLWMTYRMELWERFLEPHFWWMWAMLVLWLFFMTMIFILEPLLRGRFEERTERDFVAAFRKMIALHGFLLACAVATVCGAVEGAHGG